MMKSKLVLFMVALVALSLFVGCPKATDSTSSTGSTGPNAELKAAVNDLAEEVLKYTSSHTAFHANYDEFIKPKADRVKDIFDNKIDNDSLTDSQGKAFEELMEGYDKVIDASDVKPFIIAMRNFKAAHKNFNKAW